MPSRFPLFLNLIAAEMSGVVSGIDARLMPGYLFGLDDLLGFNAGVFPGVLLLSRRR